MTMTTMTIQPPNGYYDQAEVCVSITPVVEAIATKGEPKFRRKVEGSPGKILQLQGDPVKLQGVQVR